MVGASATGVQIADELARAGRDVVLAVGRHSRIPRRYRGMDIWWWLDRIGTFAKTIDEVSDPARARAEGALQLVGRAITETSTCRRCSGSACASPVASPPSTATGCTSPTTCRATTAAADRRLRGLLDQIDAHATANGLDAELLPAERLAPSSPSRRSTELDADAIGTVVWATGYRRPYPWLRVPVLDARARSSSGVASPRWPASTCSGSASSTAGTRTSSTASATTPPTSPATSRTPHGSRPPPAELDKGVDMKNPPTPHDVVIVGARAAGAATAMLLARAGLDVLVVDRSRYGADTLSTHALMRGGVMQLHRWGVLDQCHRRRHSRGAPDHVQLRRRHGARGHQADRTASTPSTPPAARCSTRSWWMPPRQPGRRSSSARRSRRSPATRVVGSTAWRVETAAAAPFATAPAGWSGPTACTRSSPTPSAPRSSGAAPAPPPASTATGPASTWTATSGSSGPTPAPV